MCKICTDKRSIPEACGREPTGDRDQRYEIRAFMVADLEIGNPKPICHKHVMGWCERNPWDFADEFQSWPAVFSVVVFDRRKKCEIERPVRRTLKRRS